jgi:TonB family protein
MRRLFTVLVAALLPMPAALGDKTPPSTAATPAAAHPHVDLFPSSALSPEGGTPGTAPRGTARAPVLSPTPTLLSTNVAPAWRDAESRIGRAFKPTVSSLNDGPGINAAGKQVVRMKPGATRANDGVPERSLDEEVTSQIVTAQDAADAPARWYEVELETTVDERGVLVDARVVASSGRPRLDELALEAARQAVSSEAVVDPKGRAVARWRIAAGRSVKLPRVGPVFAPGSRRVVGLSPQMPFRFDESSGKTRVVAPFTEDVKTRVRLVSVATER